MLKQPKIKLNNMTMLSTILRVLREKFAIIANRLLRFCRFISFNDLTFSSGFDPIICILFAQGTKANVYFTNI